jgi:hypothetical protein
MSSSPPSRGRDAAARVTNRAKAPIGPRVTGVLATDYLPTLAALQVPNRTNAPILRLLEAELRFMLRGPRVTGVPVRGRPTASLAFAAGRGAGRPRVPMRSHAPTLVLRTGRRAGMPVHRLHAKEVSS